MYKVMSVKCRVLSLKNYGKLEYWNDGILENIVTSYGLQVGGYKR